MPIQEKFVCPFCGFESNGAGLCPTCDETLQKVCYCGSGKFSIDCCHEQPSEEDKKAEEMIKAEVAGEAIKEIVQKEKEEIKEEEELANVEEVE